MDFSPYLLVRQAAETPTYDFTENNGPQIKAVVGFLMGFGMLVVLLRVYVRIFMTKTMGWDDYIMVVAQVSFGGCCGVLPSPIFWSRELWAFGDSHARTIFEDVV